MPSAFISHSSPDDRYVAEFVQLVRGLGYDDVFNDSHTIEPDDEFWPRIEKGIRGCDAFVVILSEASVRSYWVEKEVQFAREIGKKVVPIRIDDCELPAAFDGRYVIELKHRGSERVLAPSRILRHSPEILFGREKWLDELDAAWASRDNTHVYTLVAWGGVGKTSLVAHWVSERLAANDWPDVERYFDWSFYSQGTGESRQTSADFFINAALTFFGDPDPTEGSPWDRGARLAGLVKKYRTVLVLDGIEPLQFPANDPQAGRLKDDALAALLQGLANDNPGLCVVTTRESLTNLQSFHGSTAPEKKLDKLLKEAAVALLRHLQIAGSDEELAAAWRDAGGHALTLQLLGRFLADAHGGDIRRRDEVDFEEADRETQGRSAFKVMLAYERWFGSAGEDRGRELAILRLTGLFDRPIDPGCLEALRAEPAIVGLTEQIVTLSEAQWNTALKRLEEIDLVSKVTSPIINPQSSIANPPTTLDAHPLVREYFAKQLREQHPDSFQAAHSRLFDHLCESTKPHQPDTIDGLAPLYQAVVHGCLAGRQGEACDNVYFDRIQRGAVAYSTTQLGAVGADLSAVAAFFERPWDRVSMALPEADRAWLLNEAAFAFRLRALGRLTEAVEPMRVGLEMRVDGADWKNAASSASNLSQLELTLGRLGEAVSDARRAVDYADRSGDAFVRMAFRATLADALHARGGSGESEEARAMFAEAEAMQRERQPELDLLYSVPGFRYCDLLLAPAERAAWARSGDTPVADPGATAAALDEAERRGTQTLEWARKYNLSLLDIALDHLTLARTALYRAQLAPDANGELPDPNFLDALRRAGQLQELPRGLLTAAHYHATLGGDPAAASALLDEAQDIAERGPMPLYLADVHLHRARLFRDTAELAKARTLIEKHDYGRRRPELEDAEEASANW